MVGPIINNPRVVMMNLLNQNEDEEKVQKNLEEEHIEAAEFMSANGEHVNLEAYAVQGQTQVTFQSLMSQIKEGRKQQEIEEELRKQEDSNQHKELYSYVERFEGYSDVYEELLELEKQAALEEKMSRSFSDPELKAFGFTNEMYMLSNQKDELFQRLHHHIPYKPYVIKGESMIIGQGVLSKNKKSDYDLGSI